MRSLLVISSAALALAASGNAGCDQKADVVAMSAPRRLDGGSAKDAGALKSDARVDSGSAAGGTGGPGGAGGTGGTGFQDPTIALCLGLVYQYETLSALDDDCRLPYTDAAGLALGALTVYPPYPDADTDSDCFPTPARADSNMKLVVCHYYCERVRVFLSRSQSFYERCKVTTRDASQ